MVTKMDTPSRNPINIGVSALRYATVSGLALTTRGQPADATVYGRSAGSNLVGKISTPPMLPRGRKGGVRGRRQRHPQHPNFSFAELTVCIRSLPQTGSRGFRRRTQQTKG